MELSLNNQTIPPGLLPQLNEISDRLWSGHAAVMIGAGFSKNATPLTVQSRNFPDWNELGRRFYEKSRGQNTDGANFLNPLKLADEVQASFGRPVLHQLLRDTIPDMDFEPSELHIKLLNLPWSDVFTTNYDTLLERASKGVLDHNYQNVLTDQDLIYSEKPRIIKLHGSFPSTEPFIITEEDYRCYPSDFAPFVNTVQQSLLENTLCLIGFSGDDPNFLKWIGWIRDNLGQDKSPKIYLIGVMNLTKAQINLLTRYNIVPVNMAECEGVKSNDYYTGIERFLDYCLDRKAFFEKLEWPTLDESYRYPNFDNGTFSKDQVSEVIKEWQSQRLDYPGWMVVPHDRRDILWNYTYHWRRVLQIYSELPIKVFLEFLYEYFWRLEKCFYPIFESDIEAIKAVLMWVKKITIDSDFYAEDLSISQIKEKACFVGLVYLRFLREEGRFEEWSVVSDLCLLFQTSDDELSRYNYESCLLSLFEFDLFEMEKKLLSWDVKSNQPFWVVKKAGLMAEVGGVEDAVTLLEKALNVVRSNLNLNPVTNDYTDVSLESYILVLLRYVKNAKSFSKLDIDIDRVDFSDRMAVLKKYNCDPGLEEKLLEKPIRVKYVFPESEREEVFDVGEFKTYSSLYQQPVLDAVKLMKYYEDVGMPLRVLNTVVDLNIAVDVIVRLRDNFQHWCLVIMLRSSEVKSVDHLFNRESLSRLTVAEVDSIAKKYLTLCDDVVFEGKSSIFVQKKSLKKLLPEVFSRLVVKCSENVKDDIFDFISKVYESSDRLEYSNFRELTKRFILSLSRGELINIMPRLIDLRLSGDIDLADKLSFPNPFSYLTDWNDNFYREDLIGFNSCGFSVENLISDIKLDDGFQRDWCIESLNSLLGFGVLSDAQKSEFSDAVWSNVDENGFPKNDKFYKWVFCCSSSFRNKERIELLKKYLLNKSLKIHHQNEKGLQITGGANPLLDEIEGVAFTCGWSFQETQIIFDQLVGWWDLDKKYLEFNSDGVKVREFKKRLSRIVGVFSQLLLSNKGFFKNSKNSTELKRVVFEMSEAGIPVCEILCAFHQKISEWSVDLTQEISNAFLDSNEEFILDAQDGFYSLLRNGAEPGNRFVDHYINLISSVLVVRDNKRIKTALGSVSFILNKYPHFLTYMLETSVLFSLEKLIVETKGSGAHRTYSENLYIRQLASMVAYKLSEWYERNEVEIPRVLTNSRSICYDREEFAEVRKFWVFDD